MPTSTDVRYLDVKTFRPPRTGADRSHGHDHLHAHRRGAAAGDVLVPADHRGVRRQGGRGRRDPRHLAGRAGSSPSSPTCSPTSSASTTRSPSSASSRMRPEANIIKLPNVSASVPQLKAAVKELQEQGYDLPDYPENPQTDEDKDDPRPLRQGQGLGGQPGAARGQLRPPRAGVGQGLRQGAPAPHGRLERRLEDQRRDDGQGRLPLQRAVGGHRGRRHAAHRARRRRRHRHRAQGVGPGAGRRGRRRHLHERRRAAPLPRRADRPGQGRGRAVLGAPQGHDDEGLRPDHLRPRRPGVLPDAVRAVRRRAARPRASRPTTASARCCPRSRRCPRATRSRPPSSRVSTTARTWRWSTPTRASPTCTSPPT